MFSQQTSFILSILSIIIGIIGTITAHFVIGGPLGAVGFLLATMSVENNEKPVFSIIGFITSSIAITWFAFLCISVDKLSNPFAMF